MKVMATVNHIFPWRDMSCYIIIPVPQEKKKLHGPDLDRFSMRNSRRARAHTYKLLWSRFHLFFYSLSLSLPPRYKGLIFPESSTISSVSHLYFRRLSICFFVVQVRNGPSSVLIRWSFLGREMTFIWVFLLFSCIAGDAETHSQANQTTHTRPRSFYICAQSIGRQYNLA